MGRKEAGKFVIQVGVILLLSVAAGFLLLVLAYALPTERMRCNVAVVSEQISSEGSYYQWAKGYKNAQSDNYTDTSLYLNAMYPGSGSIIKDAMNVPRLLYGDDNNEESAVLLAIGTPGDPQTIQYGRYWHGSLIFLKPLLLLFDLADIRMFSMILQMGLLLLVVAGMYRQGLVQAVPGLFAAVIFLNPVSMVLSFCFSVEYSLMLLGMAVLLFSYEKLQQGRRMEIFFLLNGILFVYFNELCFPMIGFAFPLILCMLLGGENVKDKVKKEFIYGICWVLGYVGVWIGKWILAWIFTGYNYFMEAVYQAERYTSEHATIEAENPSLWDRICKNMQMYMRWPFLFLVIGLLVILGMYLYRNRRSVRKENWIQILPYFLVMLLPFVIYAALGNGYSYVHYWFTHKLLAISVFAGGCMPFALVEEKHMGRESHA